MKLFAVLFVAILSTLAKASPVSPAELQKRDDFTPPILIPSNTTIWNSGEVQNVTWDISQAPVNITNSRGLIQLRFDDITTPVVLADDFDILLGTYPITVPWVISGQFQLVLFGDSGNFSPFFIINGVNE